tara:strand:+ start:1052 stop:1606 length:555 start_codon:yes stop_codon:yes gene_type:complete
MPERIHKSFLKHEQSNIRDVFESMYKYIDSRTQNVDYNRNEMMNTYKNIYKDACVYILHNKSNSVYLGWIPLKNQTLLSKYYRNITKKIDFDTNVQNIPLYYIVCEAISVNNTLEIKKILCNPIIELDIDLQLLKADLLDFTRERNTTLDLSPLMRYDNGRWLFVFNYNLLNFTESHPKQIDGI